MSESCIDFHYEIDHFKLDNEATIHTWLLEISKEENTELGKLNYIFCSDEYLLKLNRQFLDHDYYTDILSFPLKQDPIEGDIFISIDRVKENAESYDIQFSEEVSRVIVHGLLHFLGYNDHNEEEKQIMRQKENYYLSILFENRYDN